MKCNLKKRIVLEIFQILILFPIITIYFTLETKVGSCHAPPPAITLHKPVVPSELNSNVLPVHTYELYDQQSPMPLPF